MKHQILYRYKALRVSSTLKIASTLLSIYNLLKQSFEAMADMSDKTIVLITGANTGLGFEMVKALYAASSKPYHIISGARTTSKADEAMTSLKETPNASSSTTFSTVQIDYESDASITAAYEHLKSQYPRIDALVNNGGAAFEAKLMSGEMSPREAWTKAYDINVTGTHLLTSTLMPLLLKSSDPRLLFITSGLSSLENARDPNSPRYDNPPAGWPKPAAGPTFVSYRSSKTALNMMMLDWHRVLKNDGVKAWAISPGFLATNLGGNQAALKMMGAGDPRLGGEFVRDVLEGARDADVGKVVSRQGVQSW